MSAPLRAQICKYQRAPHTDNRIQRVAAFNPGQQSKQFGKDLFLIRPNILRTSRSQVGYATIWVRLGWVGNFIQRVAILLPVQPCHGEMDCIVAG
jgi:uncharacterized protein involved in copper resistance